jgi:hypothetical protein
MNTDYPTGTEFEITMRVKTNYFWMDEADVIKELFQWQKHLDHDTDMNICPGSVSATFHKKGPE